MYSDQMKLQSAWSYFIRLINVDISQWVQQIDLLAALKTNVVQFLREVTKLWVDIRRVWHQWIAWQGVYPVRIP